jgi:hypothetical protein
VTPSGDFVAEVGIEVDTDADGNADFLIVPESFEVLDPALPFFGAQRNSPFARVVDLATGDLSTTFEPLNGAAAAALGGSFAGEATYETEIYFNRVVVLPATLSSLGLSVDFGCRRQDPRSRLRWRDRQGVKRRPCRSCFLASCWRHLPLSPMAKS